MEETIQFNLRLSKELIYDLELLSQRMNLSKTDWVRYKLAKLIQEEKSKLRTEMIKDIEERFYKAQISDEEFKKVTGFNPTEEMKQRRSSLQDYQKNYFQDMIKKIEAEGKNKIASDPARKSKKP